MGVLVDTQYVGTDGDDQFGTVVDATHLQVDDFVVIGLTSPSFGGGNNRYVEFDGAIGTRISHTVGFFGDSTDTFGHTDAQMVTGGFASYLFRHKVTATDLVDTGGGTGNLYRIGFRKANAADNPYATALAMWTFRGCTYASETTDSDIDAAPPSADPASLALTGSVLDEFQAFFTVGTVEGNGYAFPTTYSHTSTDDTAAPLTLGPFDWTYVAAAFNNGAGMSVSSGVGEGADCSTINYSMLNSGDTSANSDCVLAVVTFDESFTPAPDLWAWT